MGRNDPYVALGPLGTDDFQKLKVNGDGDLKVAGIFDVTTSGASGGLATKAITITDVPTLIKTDLASRDVSSARIMGNETVYIGGSTVTVANGYPKFYLEEIIADITEAGPVELYGVCEAGKTCEVRVFEIDF